MGVFSDRCDEQIGPARVTRCRLAYGHVGECVSRDGITRWSTTKPGVKPMESGPRMVPAKCGANGVAHGIQHMVRCELDDAHDGAHSGTPHDGIDYRGVSGTCIDETEHKRMLDVRLDWHDQTMEDIETIRTLNEVRRRVTELRREVASLQSAMKPTPKKATKDGK